MKLFFRKFGITTILGIAITLSLTGLALAWTNPTANPTTGAGAITVSSGNVGIGTASPGAKLDIAGGNLQLDNNGWIYLKDTINTARAMFGMGGTGVLQINQQGSFNTSINPNGGNVGIGTTAPSAKLDVIGGLRIYGGTYRTWLQQKVISSDTRSGTDLLSDLSVNVLLDQDANNGSGASFRILNGTSDSSDNTKELLRVTGSGNMGIGTTAPGAQLDITRGSGTLGLKVNYDYGTGVTGSYTAANIISSYGTGSSGAVTSLKIDTTNSGSGAAYGLIVNGGYVGIGTSSPANKLHVYTTTGADGISIDGTANPALNLRNSGTIKGYLGLVTAANSWISGSAVNDLILRTEDATNGNIIFVTQAGSLAAMKITRAGNVGIGTAAPSTLLHLSKAQDITNARDFFRIENTSYSNIYMGIKGYDFYINGAANTDGGLVFNVATGNVGIGTASPTGKLNIGYTVDTSPLTYTNGGNEGLVINAVRDTAVNNYRGYVDFVAGRGSDVTNGGSTMRFFTQPRSTGAPAQVLTLQYDGSVGVGVTAPTEKLEVNGNVKATAFLYSSDRNLKKDIEPLGSELEKVLALQPVSFNWKIDNKEDTGFIAQDVEKLFPEVVHTSETTGLKSVDYAKLTVYLVEAIKEQQKEIEILKANK